MKKKKQTLILLIVFAVTFSIIAYTRTQSKASGITKTWNFSDSKFSNLNTITSVTSVDDLTFIATNSKPMKIKKSSQEFNNKTYTYALGLEGKGNTTYRAIKIPVNNASSIEVICSSSNDSVRPLALADAKGNELQTKEATGTLSKLSFTSINNNQYVYLYSKYSGINIYEITVYGANTSDINSTTPSDDNTVPEATISSENNTTSGDVDSNQNTDSNNSTQESSSDITTETTTNTTDTNTNTNTNINTNINTSDGTVVNTFTALTNAISKAEQSGGGKIYVTGSTIDCTSQILLGKTNSNVQIIGVPNSNGTYPVLDFKSFRKNYIGKATNDSQVGIRITGSKYSLSNLIIQKAPDNGIQIKGTTAGNNNITNCIVRYNNDAGLQITKGAYNNAIKFVYSYRNCDVYTIGGYADGFAPKLAAGKGNSFYGCYAWDNSDDGWDAYDKTDGLTYDISYEECACWNNGNPNVFTGKYDYDNGEELDKNLLLVELIMAQDANFATNFNNNKFSLPSSNFINTKAGNISLESWTGSSYSGNPNGFKFGSVNTTKNCTRTIKHCLTFGHKKKGFDNNNSSVTASFDGCIAFDNGYNYHIAPFTLTKFNNCKSFDGNSADKLPSGASTIKPNQTEITSLVKTVNTTVDSITEKCNNDIIPGEIYFNVYK